MHDAADDSRYAAALSRINSTLRDELEKDDVKTWIPTRVIEQSNPVRFTTTWGGPGRWKSLHGTGNGRPVRSQTELRHADLKDPSYAWELTSEAVFP